MKVAPSLANTIEITPSSSLEIIGVLDASALDNYYISPIGFIVLLNDYRNIVADLLTDS